MEGRFEGKDVLREGRFVGGTFCRLGCFECKDVLNARTFCRRDVLWKDVLWKDVL